jgi:signal transduction histidine kinase
MPKDDPKAVQQPLEPQPPAGSEGSGAIRTLRFLVIGAILVPLMVGAVAAYLSYCADIERAEEALVEAVAVAEENTLKVLETHQLIAARIADALGGLTDPQIATQEPELHNRLLLQIKDLPQVAAAWVIDATGHEIVSARVYPVNRELDHSQREDFRALQRPDAQTFIWALRARSLGQDAYRPYFTVARRWLDPDGRFRGIIVVSVSGAYLASFYGSLLGSSTEYTAGIFREDGSNLARYPENGTEAAVATQNQLLVSAIADTKKSGVVASGAFFSTEGQIAAYRRVADYPVYVTVTRTRASIVKEWLYSIVGYAAVGTLGGIGFVCLSLVALRRTRREQIAQARTRDAITARAEAEHQLHQAQKMEAVGQLTAGIAHDFNNLLTVIAGNMTMAEQVMNSDKERLQRYIEQAMKGCERAAALTHRLLTFSRRKPLDLQPVDVNAVISGMSDLLWRSLGDGISRDVRLADNVWPVLVDPNQLENSLLNLALNARDAMSERGRLTVETANCSLQESDIDGQLGMTTGDHVVISVGDTGRGMPAEVRERVFEPFFTTKTNGKGTGLGLPQIYGFVQRSGGSCTIDSEPGRGTTIKLYLPRYTGAMPTSEAGKWESVTEEDLA